MYRLFSLLVCGALCATWAAAQANRVLVIYNSHPTYNTDSLDVANYYLAQRGIPTANRCGISFPDRDTVTEAQWNNTYREAIRGCLDAVGRTNILYVVFSYKTPYRLFRDFNNVSSLDSYVADIWDSHSATMFPRVPSQTHRYYMAPQSAGNVYGPFQTLAAYRATGRSSLIYSVWRLDGDTPARAKGLVTKAITRENAGGLAPGGIAVGTSYIDRWINLPILTLTDSSYSSGEHDLNRAAKMVAAAGLPLVQDLNQEEFGTAPAPLTAPNAILYCGWYSLGVYNNVFTFPDGAVGWHLDSASALDPRQGTNWVANAIQNGITVTSGAVAEPFLEGLANPDIVFRHLLQGGVVGDAFLRGTGWVKWKIIHVGDPLYRPFPGGVAPWNSPTYSELQMSITPAAVIGGGKANLTVTLPQAAPPGGQLISLSNNWAPYYVNFLPSTYTIPAGQRSATFPLNTLPVETVNPIGMVAQTTVGNEQVSNSLMIYSWLGGISVQSSIVAGTSTTAAVVLNGLATQPGGRVVTLTSSQPGILQVPQSVTVPVGSQVALFTVTSTTGSVGAPIAVTITATTGVHVATQSVSVTP